jgi:hypothetical protein
VQVAEKRIRFRKADPYRHTYPQSKRFWLEKGYGLPAKGVPSILFSSSP